MTAAENTTEFRALATELLAEFGIEATWTYETGGTFVPGAGAVSGLTTSTKSKVLTSPPVPADRRYFSDDVLQTVDAMSFVADPGLGFTPRPGNTVEMVGSTWAVVAVQSFYPGTSAAAHAVALRRG